jgi:hypothetical protein
VLLINIGIAKFCKLNIDHTYLNYEKIVEDKIIPELSKEVCKKIKEILKI